MKSATKRRVTVIGMGMGPADLTLLQREVIQAADVLIGGRRHLAEFEAIRARKVVITADLDRVVATIRAEPEDRAIVVLASGDPLYYGIGDFLIRAMGREAVAVWPNVSAVAAAFARIGEPWQDARVVSLHGRKHGAALDEALESDSTVAVFTDAKHSPAWLAEHMLSRGGRQWRLCVLERMGYPDEKVAWFTPGEARIATFASPNLVVLKPVGEDWRPTDEKPCLGMPEAAFEHQQGMITKFEVRAVALALLQLQPGIIVWDLGAGSGALAIEAGLLVPGGQVWAVEKDRGRIAQIETNRRRYGMGNLAIRSARMPEGLDDLPDPHRIFIGGGGSDLKAIIDMGVARLRAGGLVVVSAVMLASLQTAWKGLQRHGFRPEVRQIQVHRSEALVGGLRMTPLNPVWLIRGFKPHSIG